MSAMAIPLQSDSAAWMAALNAVLGAGGSGGAAAAASGWRGAADGDADLAAAAALGSRPAFDRIVGRHQQAVRSFLRRLCGDAALADDLAQETFIAAWTGLWRYKGGASLRSWLCAIAWRKHQDAVRARRRADRREAAAGEAEALAASGAGAPAEARLDLATALAGLPAEQRAAVALCLGADFSHAEAAEALGLPLGTVKSHVARGREKLLARLQGGETGAAHD
ncbi:RNA polymerase sigma factor [Caulobacter sp. KR2-114]|uniref:RNA polymerase sigma factor n=1 Tax=Caulobacter sp. KR2-114 TaxID=3400912 RepID=UPI003C08FF90